MSSYAAKESVEQLREELGGDSFGSTVMPLCANILEQLQAGEPTNKQFAGAVLMLSDTPPGHLGVVVATEAMTAQSQRCKRGATWKPNSPNKLSVEAFHVLKSGQDILRSPHGTDENAISLAPLKERSGRTFAVLVSGAPAVPDDFLHAMAVTAGPLLERIYKWQKVNALMRVAITWIRKLSPKVSFVEWQTGAEATRPLESGPKGRAKSWQPLFFMEGHDMRRFALELRWSDETLYATLGTIHVHVADHETLCSATLELLQTTAQLLQDACEEIERMHLGHPSDLHSMEGFGSAYDASRLMLPARLQEQFRAKVADMNVDRVFAEIKSYKEAALSADTRWLMAGMLTLLGRSHKKINREGWSGIKKELNRQLVDEMLELDLGASMMQQTASSTLVAPSL